MANPFDDGDSEVKENGEQLKAETEPDLAYENTNEDDIAQEISGEATSNVDLQGTGQKDEQKNKNNRDKVKFNEIEIDDTLPEHGVEAVEDLSIQQKILTMQDKSVGALDKLKAHPLAIIIVSMLIVGVIMIAVSLNEDDFVVDNLVVIQLPQVSANIFNEDGSQTYNVKVDLSVGVKLSESKGFDVDACYNVVYDIISDMEYEQFSDINAQYIIKDEVPAKFKEKTGEDIDIKVYIYSFEVRSSSANASGDATITQKN